MTRISEKEVTQEQIRKSILEYMINCISVAGQGEAALAEWNLAKSDCSLLNQITPYQMRKLQNDVTWSGVSVFAKELFASLNRARETEAIVLTVVRHTAAGAPKSMIQAKMGISDSIWEDAVAMCEACNVPVESTRRGRRTAPSSKALRLAKEYSLGIHTDFDIYYSVSKDHNITTRELWYAQEHNQKH